MTLLLKLLNRTQQLLDTGCAGEAIPGIRQGIANHGHRQVVVRARYKGTETFQRRFHVLGATGQPAPVRAAAILFRLGIEAVRRVVQRIDAQRKHDGITRQIRRQLLLQLRK